MSGLVDPALLAEQVVLAVERVVREHLVPERRAGRERLSVWVAFSGGLDSAVLLQACRPLPDRHPIDLRAIHVHHGLHPEADRWVRTVEASCHQAGVPLQVAHVQVDRQQASLEDAARRARYGVFDRLLTDGGLLLQAHHRDDQAETVLYRVLQGHGVEGLAGIPACRALSGGTLERPLLGFGRQELAAVASHWSLSWVDDDSNRDCTHARNFLRHAVLPLVAERFPAVRERLARLGGWMQEAAVLVDEWVGAHLPSCETAEGRLDLHRLRGYPPDRQRWLVRHWLRVRGERLSESALLELQRQLLEGRSDSALVWRGVGGTLHQYRGTLFWCPDEESTVISAEALGAGEWDGRAPLTLPDGRVLELPAGLDPGDGPFRVGFRRGGERLWDARGGHHRALKKILQEAGVPTWERGRVPLLFRGDQLIHVWLPGAVSAGPEGSRDR